LNNIFVLKIAIKLYKTNILNLEQFFYKEIKSIVEIKEICVLKLLNAINLNIYQLFLKRLLIIIAIAHKKFKVEKLLIQEYNITSELYFIYTII